MFIKNRISACTNKHADKSKLSILAVVLSGAIVQTAIAVSPVEIPYVTGDTIRWSSPFWHQVQSRDTSEFVCQGGASCTVTNGSYWVTEHRPDGSGSGWLLEVVDGENGRQPLLTRETFSDAISVDGNVISWPLGGWYQVQDTETYTERCFGNINSCRLDAPGEYKVTNHSLGLNTTVVLGQDTGPDEPFPFVLEGSLLSLPEDGWYQVQTTDTYETVCESGRSCILFPGTYNIINHTSGERWNNFEVAIAFLPLDRPNLTRAECISRGGSVIGDIGDGSTQRPDYRCESGVSPIGAITFLEGEPIAIEGEVCCV